MSCLRNWKNLRQIDFNQRAKIAAFFGTLQAGFTDFHYLRPVWKKNTEKDSLIGVGITGICNVHGQSIKEGEKIPEEGRLLLDVQGLPPLYRADNTIP